MGFSVFLFQNFMWKKLYYFGIAIITKLWYNLTEWKGFKYGKIKRFCC